MIDIHIQASDPPEMVSYLVALTAAVHSAMGAPPLAQQQRDGLALFTTDELMAELAARGEANGSVQGVLFDMDGAPSPQADQEVTPRPPAKKRGRPAKEPAVPAPEPHPTTGELFPQAEALPAKEPELPDMGVGGVASTGPDKVEMERLISALYSRGKDAAHMRDFMVSVTGEPTLGKTPKEKWPVLKAAIEQELKNLDARVG